MKVYSEVADARTGILQGMLESKEGLRERVAWIDHNLPRMQDLVFEIVVAVKGRYPTARYDFGEGQDSVGWQLTFYIENADEWDDEIVASFVRVAATERLELYVTVDAIENIKDPIRTVAQ